MARTNQDVIDAVFEHLEKHPEQLDMGDWLRNRELGWDMCYHQEANPALLPDQVINHCGTTGCFAGWVSAFGRKMGRIGHVGSPADQCRLLLDLDMDQADRLFYDNHWPPHLYKAYGAAFDNPARRVAILKDAVNQLIPEE